MKRHKKFRPSTALFTIFFIACYSRGIAELIATKELGYLIGILSLAFILSISIAAKFFKRKQCIQRPEQLPLIFFFLYSLFALISLFSTTLANGQILIGILYILIHLYLLFSISFLSRNSPLKLESISRISLITGTIILVSGLLDYFGIIEFPGAWTYGDYVRLSGSLGSKQHFSFASAGFSLLLYFFYLRNRHLSSLILSIGLAGISFLSFSRTGYPLIIGALILYYFPDLKSVLLKSWKIALGGVVILTIPLIFANETTVDIIVRSTSIISFSDLANAQRYEAWIYGIETVLSGPIFFGDNAGLYSQSGSRLGLASSLHFESAIIQQFANFGLFGGFFFICYFVSYISKIFNRLLRSIAWMAFASFWYYPGSEVIPIIAFWIMIAMIDAESRPQRHLYTRSIKTT